jgi:2-iminobutanoate/2-iminopropanoate deaminase
MKTGKKVSITILSVLILALCAVGIIRSTTFPLDPATGAFVPGGTSEQAEQSIKNLLAVLEAAGCKAEDVVKTTVFLIDIGDFAVVNEVYAKYFKGECPARCAMQVSALPKGALVEIEAIAVKP